MTLRQRREGRLALVLVVSAGVLACGAAAASAATVSWRGSVGARYYDGISYVAEPGETNDLLIAFQPDGPAVTVSDPGAVITPVAPCVRVDEHTATCPPKDPAASGGLEWATVALGDGDDRLLVSGGDDTGSGELVVDAGPGNDRVSGGESNDRLNGGGGVDELHGQGGWDWISDGDRDGAPGELAPGPDVLDAGDGESDRLDYRQRTEPVRVDLHDPGTDGAPGEGDILRGSFDYVYGGSGDDLLAGADRSERFIGGGGRDRLIGRGGDDRFRSPGEDSISCGSGDDQLKHLTATPFVEPGCEHYVFTDSAWFKDVEFPLYPVSADGPLLRFRIPCENDDPGEGAVGFPCSANVRLWTATSPRRLLARGKLRRFDTPETVSVRLNARGIQLARRRSGARMTFEFRGRYLPDVSWTLQIKLPR